MTTPITMPQLGETVIEGTITRWLKKEGETIERDEPLFEISTDKVDTEVPSPVAGTVVRIKVQEGETVTVGTELAEVDTGDGSPASVAPTTEAAPEQPPAETAETASAGAEAEAPAAETPAVEAPAAETPPAEVEPAAVAPGERSNLLSPLVRRLAEENNIDLSRVQGTGNGGRITRNDVIALMKSGGAAETAPAPDTQTAQAPAAQAPAAPAAQSPAAEAPAAEGPAAEEPARSAGDQREELVPLSRMRQAIAGHMLTSLHTSARAWNLVEVNMENITRIRNRAKEDFREREGVNLTYMPFVAKAVCDALLAFPEVNSELREDQLVLKRYVNLGVAVALDDGLIVPVVKNADGMNLVGLARAINDIATRARSRKLNPDDVHGGTFTITNPGPYGSIMSVPIINQPQCAILAFDAVEKRPVVVDDAIAIRHMVYLSMSWDHRIIDGATAAKFLGRLKENLETMDFGPEVGIPAGS
jgi:pyruvate dehydrogenase E2 component (dihydrolipoamide acetyltransferase)